MFCDVVWCVGADVNVPGTPLFGMGVSWVRVGALSGVVPVGVFVVGPRPKTPLSYSRPETTTTATTAIPANTTGRVFLAGGSSR